MKRSGLREATRVVTNNVIHDVSYAAADTAGIFAYCRAAHEQRDRS